MSKISIILPIYNEEKYILDTLNSLITNNEITADIEIIIVDGNSSDNTVTIVKQFIQENREILIKLLINYDRTVSYSMNMGILDSTGDIIIRLDAHSLYPENYINILVNNLNKLNASNVGAVVETIPSANTVEAKSISIAISSSFGVGGSDFRIGGKQSTPYEVDTVPFGCYRKKVFDKIGLYDTDLIRNQDDELNARLIQNNEKIFLLPSLKIKYYARDKFSKMFKMFYQYGYFKPLVNIKLARPSTTRQFIPPLFVLYLFMMPLFLLIGSSMFLYSIGLGIYLIANIFISILIAKEKKSIIIFPYLIYTFFLLHFSYGLGYIKGLIDFQFLRRHKKSKSNKINISR